MQLPHSALAQTCQAFSQSIKNDFISCNTEYESEQCVKFSERKWSAKITSGPTDTASTEIPRGESHVSHKVTFVLENQSHMCDLVSVRFDVVCGDAGWILNREQLLTTIDGNVVATYFV